MSWGTLDQSVKIIDVSHWQGEIDWPEFRRLNPDVKQVILRVAGGWGIDNVFRECYQGALAVGYKPGIYINNNPAKTLEYMRDNWWLPLLDGLPDPTLVVLDAETNGWRDKNGKWHDRYPRAVVTDQLKAIYDWMGEQWPDARRWIYSGHWWGENVLVRQPWMYDVPFWTPHYIYYVNDDGRWRMAYSYEEHDPHLPEERSWIPRLPVGIDEVQIVAWQISDKGIVLPISDGPNNTPRVDLNYVTVEEYERIWGKQDPVEPPVEPPVVVEPCEPIERVVVTAHALNLRSTPSTAEKPLGALLRGARVPIYDTSGDWGQVAENVWIHTGWTEPVA